MTDHEVALARLSMRLLLAATPLLYAGRRVHDWTLVEYLPGRRGGHHESWLCRCVCGELGKVQTFKLKNGSKSCGHGGTKP